MQSKIMMHECTLLSPGEAIVTRAPGDTDVDLFIGPGTHEEDQRKLVSWVEARLELIALGEFPVPHWPEVAA